MAEPKIYTIFLTKNDVWVDLKGKIYYTIIYPKIQYKPIKKAVSNAKLETAS